MTQFYDKLREGHPGAWISVSGRGGGEIPFDEATGFWEPSKAGKATRTLVHLYVYDGVPEGKIPDNYAPSHIRLGQINFSSMREPSVVGFTVFAATPDSAGWRLLDVSWLLAFRLSTAAVETVHRAFSHHSSSGIEMRLGRGTGDLFVYSRATGEIACSYLAAGLLMNHDPNAETGIPEFTYAQATEEVTSLYRVNRTRQIPE